MSAIAIRNVTIKNENGIHVRPATLIFLFVQNNNLQLSITHNGKKFAVDSIIPIIIAAMSHGDELILEITAENAEQLADQLVEMFDNKFGIEQ